MLTRCSAWRISISILLCGISIVSSQTWTPVIVKTVTPLGLQQAQGVTDVSRDGGYSALINEKIVWLYDDTECMDRDGNQLSFVSNTAAYADQPNENVLSVADFGVVMVGRDNQGRNNYAILADNTVGMGGWIPFQPEELEFNVDGYGKERVAIWPGTSPTSISTTQAFLFAPLVYVDSKPQDPSEEYQGRGMTLIAITAPSSGPVATRQGEIIIPGQEVAFGGFSTLLGFVSTDGKEDPNLRDVYLLGMISGGLQLARVGLDDISSYDKYTFFDPKSLNFSKVPSKPTMSDYTHIYLPGTFSSGSVFFSPYFGTFIMVYFNKMVDSTFYIRYLNIEDPEGSDPIWVKGGKNGKGIQAEDAEALVKYSWSPQQKLYASPPGKGGFNYAGMAHPEYFNRQYYAKSLYPDNTPAGHRKNAWYGSHLVAEADAGGDGKYLLLSWTSQVRGGQDAGIYKVQLAVVEFDDIPARPTASTSSASITGAPSITSGSTSPPPSTTTHKSINLNMIPKGSGSGDSLGSLLSSNYRQVFEIGRAIGKVVFWLSVVGIGGVFLRLPVWQRPIGLR